MALDSLQLQFIQNIAHFSSLVGAPRIPPRPCGSESAVWSFPASGAAKEWVGMVVRFVCVIRVPVCALCAPVRPVCVPCGECPVCVPVPPVFLPRAAASVVATG